MKKNILIVGSSSDIARSLMFNSNYNYTKLTSKENGFDIMDKTTFPEIKNIDGIVYFPGTINLKPFNSLKASDFQKDYEINVVGLINILQYYISNLNNNSSLVFLSTVAVKVGLKFHASISMCKAAIEGLTRSLASELSPKVRVNCVSPSIISTKLSSRILKNETTKEKIINDHPLKRIGEPEDIANMIEFLLSNKSSWITGQNMHVDGGLSSIKI
ncbi:MAG: oxidoreductase [Flavobacteriales bacterium]|nr:oxidoreductase [Flavobacteriales bacterium]